MNEFLLTLQPSLLALLVAVLIGVIGLGGDVLLKYRKAMILKYGVDAYNGARVFAIGLYTLLEDQFADVIKAGALKKAEMEKLILAKFPTLTQAELDAINKEVWAAMQDLGTEILDPAE
jgi:hypothetical protein